MQLFTQDLIDLFGNFITQMGYLRYYKPKEGDVIIDCGGFFGRFSRYVSKKVGNSGKILVFEPNPLNFLVLKEKVRTYRNVFPINKALFNEETELDMFSPKLSSNSSVFENQLSSPSVSINKVKSVKLDDIINEFGIKKIDFIKMDIEGSEIEALEGGKETLKITNNLAIACYHKRNGTTTGEILKPVLEKMGLKVKIGYLLHKTLYAFRG